MIRPARAGGDDAGGGGDRGDGDGRLGPTAYGAPLRESFFAVAPPATGAAPAALPRADVGGTWGLLTLEAWD